MKKTIFIGLAALCLSATLMAQEVYDNVLRINFIGEDNPIETEHYLLGTHITFSEDGRAMNLTVNDATATYDLSHVSGMTTFSGTPSVSLHASEDPDNKGKYYTTFYSGLEAYTIPNGVKAYTAVMEEETIILTDIVGDILPQGEAVLLYSNSLPDGQWMMEVADGSTAWKTTDNLFDGVDVTTEQDGNTYYMLTYGQNNLRFYMVRSSVALPANEAYIALSPSARYKSIPFLFIDEMFGDNTRINAPVADAEGAAIYSPSGVRQTRLQQGINIVNGKKIVVK